MKNERQVDSPNFYGLFRHFLNNIESVMIFIQELENVVHEYEEINTKKQLKILNEYFVKQYDRKLFDDTNTAPKVERKEKPQITEEEARQIFQAVIDCNFIKPKQKDLLFNSSFIILISHFQYLFSKLLHIYFSMFPEFLSNKSISIKFEDLQYYNEIEELSDIIIEKSVEEITYKPFQAQIDFFEKSFKIDCRKSYINWDLITESIERRNIAIHNNNIVNEKYLNKTKGLKLDNSDKKIELNTYLNVNNVYFNSIYRELIIAGTLIHHECWKKWDYDNYIIENVNAQKFLLDFIENNQLKDELKDFQTYYLKFCN